MRRWSWLIAAIALLMVGTAVAKERAVQKKAKDFSVEIQMEKDPPVVGINRVEIVVTDEDGRVVNDAKVIMTAFMPAMPGTSLVMNKAEARLEGGKYRARIDLPRSGPWEMAVHVIQGGRSTTAKWTVNAR